MISALYIHHAGVLGGASRSLLELLNAFPSGQVTPHIIVQRGSVVGIIKKMGIEFIAVRGISIFDNTQYGHYRGLRWLLLLRELYYAPFTLAALWRAKRIWDIDIIHVNEVPQLLPIILAKLIFRKPVIVHLRSLQYRDSSWRTALVSWVLRRYVDRIIAIDQTVKQSLSLPNVDVVHNGFALTGGIGDEIDVNPLVNLRQDALKVLMVGNVLSFKGSYEFVMAANSCKQRGLDVEFVILGSSSRKLKGLSGYLIKKFGLARDVMTDIRNYIKEHELENHVHIFPVTLNIRSFYEHVDVLCFPSYLNAVGRPVFEAAFSKVPSIVAIKDPLPDTFIEGITGLRIPEKDAEALTGAIEYCYAHRDEVVRMGKAAYQLALQNFDINKNAVRVQVIYQECLSKR